jgi:uncharacterized membrane protein YfcA
MIDQWWFLLVLGFGVGALGTLIGAGGGFILVPILLVLMPKARAEEITAISLAVVFFNATSGSIAYWRMGRVDLKSAAWFALATFPGAVLGPITTQWIPRFQFNLIFGGLLVIASTYLVLKPAPVTDLDVEPNPNHTRREIVDAEGTEHIYHFPMGLGVGLSVFVGYLASLLGIGGGIIHVPMLNRLLNFPVHIATATSHAILSFVALTGTIVHLAHGNLNGHMDTAILLGVGAVVGAQAGAQLSKRLHGNGIIRALAVALGLVGIRILIATLSG